MSYMTDERFSLDTNILFYAIDNHDIAKHERASVVLEQLATRHGCIVPVQTYAEFFSAAIRKGKMSLSEAAAQIEDWQALFSTAYPRPGSLAQAIRGVRDHSLSFWDAMLWSVAKDSGATILLTEDFQDGQELGGVCFRNPLIHESLT
jgi:predicted nucleic acid-binding protein